MRSRRVSNSKGDALFEIVPTAALINCGLSLAEIGIYSALKEESACGARFVRWIGGEELALKRHTGFIRVSKFAERYGVSRQSVSKALARLERNGFLTVTHRSRLGFIYAINPVESVPCVAAVVRIVKAASGNAESALSAGKSFVFNPEQISSWATLGNVLGNVKNENTPMFIRGYKLLQERAGQPFGQPKNSTALATNSFSTRSENSPASAGPKSLQAAIAAGSDSVASNSGLSASLAASEPLKTGSASEGEGWILPPTKWAVKPSVESIPGFVENFNAELARQRVLSGERPREHVSGLACGEASEYKIFAEMSRNGEFARTANLVDNQVLITTTSDNS